jgi:DNA-3-methyladenine glycosylase
VVGLWVGAAAGTRHHPRLVRCRMFSERSVDAQLPPGAVIGHGFFARPSDQVGHDLIGKILWKPGVGGGRLTEVEAYLPESDPASHAAHGPTKRNTAMYGPPGTIYVFLSYGVHYLLNFVTEVEGVGSAVLIRAMEGARSSHCGPGRVGAALGVHPGLNGLALGAPSGLFVLDDGARPEVGMTTRIGISRGATLPLRYYALSSKCVTRRSAIREGN